MDCFHDQFTLVLRWRYGAGVSLPSRAQRRHGGVMTRLASIKAAGSIVFCIATAIAASSQTSSNPGQPTTTVARIVKIVHLKNQTGSIGPITLYTPQEAGLFRVSLFMVATVGVGRFGSICPYLSFTDSVGPGLTLGTFCLGSDTKGNVCRTASV